jgi:hypothetical protein
MTDTTSAALPDLRAGSFTRRITLAGRYTGTTPGGGHGFEVGGVVNPRDIGITHPAIKKPVTIQITAGLVPA